jgi:hypothetical protein
MAGGRVGTENTPTGNKKMIHDITSGIYVIFLKLVLQESEKSGAGGDFKMN